jgi:hypothetical protein
MKILWITRPENVLRVLVLLRLGYAISLTLAARSTLSRLQYVVT